MEIERLASNLSNTHASLFYDNTSAVGWTFKLRSGSSLAAGRILRFLGMRIHATQYSHRTPISIEGEDNYMADAVSRTFQKGKLFSANKSLTAYFQTNFPFPQGHSWTKFNIPPKWTQRVMLCLIGERLMLGSLLRLPGIRKNTGRHGNAMPPHGTSTPSSKAVTQIDIIIVVTYFSAQVRKGYYGKGVQIKIPTVAKIIDHHHIHPPG